MVIKYYNSSGLRTNNFSSISKRTDPVGQVKHVPLRSRCFDAASKDADKFALPTPITLSTFWDEAESALLSAISPEWQVLLPSQRHTRIWLQEIACRAKNDSLLSHAIRALSSLYLGTTRGAQGLILTAQAQYTSSLKIMISVLSKPCQDISNVQSAAILLTFFEVRAICTIFLPMSKQY